jgi:hypothetical protein
MTTVSGMKRNKIPGIGNFMVKLFREFHCDPFPKQPENAYSDKVAKSKGKIICSERKIFFDVMEKFWHD